MYNKSWNKNHILKIDSLRFLEHIHLLDFDSVWYFKWLFEYDVWLIWIMILRLFDEFLRILKINNFLDILSSLSNLRNWGNCFSRVITRELLILFKDLRILRNMILLEFLRKYEFLRNYESLRLFEFFEHLYELRICGRHGNGAGWGQFLPPPNPNLNP